MHILDDTAQRATHGLALDDIDVLGAHDDHAVAEPVEGDVAEDVHEADERDDIRDAGAGRVGDGALDRGEDGTAGNTHDEDTGTAAGVAAEVGGTQGEDGGVHGGLEEEDDDEDGDGGGAVAGADVGVEGDGDAGVHDHDEVGREDGGQARRDEAADGEGDERV